MSSVLLVKTAVTDGEVAPQGESFATRDRGWLIAPQEHWHHLLLWLRLVLLLGVRQLFLEEIYNHSTLGAPLHIRFHLRRLRPELYDPDRMRCLIRYN